MASVLANWLWQGCAVALAATAVLRLSRRMSATTRYHLWWVTLIVILVLPFASLRLPASSSQQPTSSYQPSSAPASASTLSQSDVSARAVGSERAATPGDQPEAGNILPGAGSIVLPAVPWWMGALLALVWSVSVAVSLSRTAAALVTLRRAKRSARPFPAAREGRLQTWLSLRTRGRRAGLIVSDEVRAAAVLGLTAPSIAVAPIALDALSDDELDQIIVHEWAHVHRRDDIARLVQRLIVAIAGLHPAVRWIDRQLHLERETACDDWAVNATGSARALAVSLTKLASLPGRRSEAVLLPAALISSELTTRVVRLLDKQRNTSTARTFGAPMLVTPVLGALALTVASMDLVVTASIAAEARTAVITAPEGAAAAPWVAAPVELQAAFSGPLQPPRRSRERTPAKARAAVPSGSSERGARPAPPVDADPAAEVVEMRAPAAVPLGVETRDLNASDLPGTTTAVTGDVLTPRVVEAVAPAGPESAKSSTLWGVAADAGVTVGKGSQKAAVATAGFFTRLNKSVTRVF